MAAMRPAVTVCIPAYQAEAFLAETLASVRAQTWPGLRVVISFDRDGDRTSELAHAFAADNDASVSIVEQERRLGWVGNVNAVLACARTPYAMILPHDDILAPTYVESCLHALLADSQVVAAYTDVETFGLPHDFTIIQPSLVGSTRQRVETFLRDHFNAVAFRAVFDVRRARRCLVPTYAFRDFAADTLWMARLMCRGHLVRVAQPLYRKRYHPDTVHRGWPQEGDPERDDIWITHCAELVWEILRARPALAVERRFWDAVRDRLLIAGDAEYGGRAVPARLRDGRDPIVEAMRAYWTIRRGAKPSGRTRGAQR